MSHAGGLPPKYPGQQVHAKSKQIQHITIFCGNIGERALMQGGGFTIDDSELIRLYRIRSEDAIAASDLKYGAYCNKIAMNVLGNADDAGECVNDVWLKAWNTFSIETPQDLRAYFARSTRGLAIDRWRKNHSKKRGGGELVLCLDELSECVPAAGSVEAAIEREELRQILRHFIADLEPISKHVFLCRYWYFDTVPEIAERFGFSRSKVTSMLHRTRKRLKAYLKENGYSDEDI